MEERWVLSCLWEDGLYSSGASPGELIVSDRERVWRTRTVQREPIDHGPEDAHEMIHKTPWTEADEDEVQGETEKLVTEMTEAEKEAEKRGRGQDLAQPFGLWAWLHGDCPGCRAAMGRTTGRRPELASRRGTQHEKDRGVFGEEGGGVGRQEVGFADMVLRALAMMRRTPAWTSTAKESENEEGGVEQGEDRDSSLAWRGKLSMEASARAKP